jgi:hypothetical protein
MRTPFLVAFLAACAVSGMPIRAVIIYSEGFDYGVVAGPMNGRNGGTGFADVWVGNNSDLYIPDGLAFSDLSVSGGKGSRPPSTNANTGFNRRLASSLNGVYYGSFLSQIEFGAASAGMSLGAPGTFGGPGDCAIFAPYTSSALRVSTGISSFDFSGSALLEGQTYLTMFKIDAGTAGTPGIKKLTVWLMDAAQYDALKVGGFNEGELNAATVGTGESDVWARVSLSGLSSMPIPSYLNMILVNNGASTIDLDEFRLSNESLNEAVPAASIPEPGISLLGFLGSALLGLSRPRG